MVREILEPMRSGTEVGMELRLLRYFVAVCEPAA